MTCDRSLVSVVNALEGYRLRLDGDLEVEHRAMFERLVNQTLNTAVDYRLPVIPYITWFAKYQTNHAASVAAYEKRKKIEAHSIEDEV